MIMNYLNHYMSMYHVFRIGVFLEDYKIALTKQYHLIAIVFFISYYLKLDHIQAYKCICICNLCIFLGDVSTGYHTLCTMGDSLFCGYGLKEDYLRYQYDVDGEPFWVGPDGPESDHLPGGGVEKMVRTIVTKIVERNVNASQAGYDILWGVAEGQRLLWAGPR